MDAGHLCAFKELAVEIPAQHTDLIEVKQKDRIKARVSEGAFKVLPRIAFDVFNGLIDAAVEPLALGDKDDRVSVWGEAVVKVGESCGLVGDVFEHVEAEDGVDLADVRGEACLILCVHPRDFEVRAILSEAFELLKVERIKLGGDVAFLWEEVLGEGTHSCTDFHDALFDKRANDVSHPMVESLGLAHGFENIRPTVVFVEIVFEGVFEEDAERVNPVFPCDFFAFFISAPVVIDGDFVDAEFAFGDFDGDLGFKAKTFGADGDAFEDFGAKGFVACFHVCEVEIGDGVGEQGQELVSERMPKEQNLSLFTGEKTRAINDVCFSRTQGSKEVFVVVG